jgi:hypothetical protein
MWSKLLAATGLTLALALPAAAQSTQSPSSDNSNASSGQQAGQGSQDAMHVRQKVKQDLEQAGFTNVQVMPESFLVRAKDKQGRPVMMVINPDSVTAVTEMNGNGQSGSSSNSSGSNSSGSNSSGSSNSTKQ